jgi:RNA polymerase sigma factor FliA
MTAPQPNFADRDALVIQHVGLVKAMAHRLAQRLPSQVEMTDLISVGVLGLIDAAGRYRPAMGVPFDAFARRRVQGAMLDALRDLDWAPRSLRRMRRDLDATIARLRHDLAREPTEHEIAAAMALSSDEYNKVLEQVRTLDVGAVRQLDAVGEDGTPLLELCMDPDENPEAQLQRTELRALLARALLELPDRERQVLALYYEEELTMAEIGEVIGVCESRVSQLRSLAISRLRASLRTALNLPEKVGKRA